MEEARCGAQTRTGGTCRNRSDGPCHVHAGPTCAVCLAALTRGTRKLPCGHTFHVPCIDRWKRSCPGGSATCPMCREPFDRPTYKCRLIIQRVSDGVQTFEDFAPTNVEQIIEGFGLDLRPNSVTFLADIHFDIEQMEDLAEELRMLGLPQPLFELPVRTMPRLTPNAEQNVV
jgi:hypothetical protein